MASFNNLKTSLKQKWLQFFQVNRYWITLHMEIESVYTPDGGRRPPSSLILGVVNALEPQLAELMVPFSKLNPVPDALIEVLELNFDPDLLLNRFNSQAISEELSEGIVIQTLTELESDELSDMPFNEIADEVVLVETDDGSLIAMSEDEAAVLVEEMAAEIALNEMADEVVLVQTDDESVVAMSPDEVAALADAMVLDEMANQGVFEETSDPPETASAPQPPLNESLEPSSTPSTQQTESGDLMSDVWVEDASSNSEAGTMESQIPSTTSSDVKKQPEDDEISRLFPNL